METISINGIRYLVLLRKTARDLEPTHPKIAEQMRANKVVSHLLLKRPKGKKGYFAVVYANGGTSVATIIDARR